MLDQASLASAEAVGKKRVPKQLLEHQFKTGVVRLIKKKGQKQAAKEYLSRMMDFRVPDEWLINGLEPLRGLKLTFLQAILFRESFCAVAGVRNPGFKDGHELLRRIMGNVPTVIKHGEATEEDLDTPETLEQLKGRLEDMLAQIQNKQKALPEHIVDAEIIDAKEEN